MRYLVPKMILENFRNKKYSGSQKYITFSLDIVGFTPITEKLMESGSVGAEVVSEVINKYLGYCIAQVYQNYGFISTFAGDAFLAFFPVSKMYSALYAAAEIARFSQQNMVHNSALGDFEITFRGGFSLGSINWKIVRNEYRNSFYFYGQPIDDAILLQEKAEAGEILVDTFCSELIGPGQIRFSRKGAYALQINKVKPTPKCYKISKINSQNEFMPRMLLEDEFSGEFRNIISCFLTLQKNEHIDENIKEIINLSRKFGGYFKDIHYELGKVHILVYFGAPVAVEHPFSRALNFVLENHLLFRNNMKCGLAFGTVFSGFIDTEFRSEFLAIGKKVNMASRLNTLADWGQILLDSSIYKQSKGKYQFVSQPPQKLKGFKNEIRYYQLLSASHKSYHYNNMIGREAEYNKLKTAYFKFKTERKFNIVNILGEAGIGKSFLIDKFHQDKLKQGGFKWFKFSCNEQVQTEMNSLENFLKDYFEIKPENNMQKNQKCFNSKLNSLLRISQDPAAAAELKRTKSLLAGLIGIYWPNSLYQKLDAKGRENNTIRAILSLLQNEVSVQPVVLEIEDVHWIDKYSFDFFKTVISELKHLPFLIITSSRLRSQETKFSFHQSLVTEKYIHLQIFNKLHSQNMITERLGKKISARITDLIWQLSGGNPFFIEQFINYLQENELLKLQNQTWVLSSKIEKRKIAIPHSINAIIIARVDRLTSRLKQMVKTASVLGREFAVELLSSMLRSATVDDLLLEGQKRDIWYSISEIIYVFKHALIRESVYNMQLKKQLRSLHELAAKTIEKIYYKNLADFYDDLAYHYEMANISAKMIIYLEKAGDKARFNYQNESAINKYEKLLDLLKNNSLYQKLATDVLIKLGNIYNLIGKREISHEKYEQSLQKAIDLQDDERIIAANLHLASYYKLKGEISQALELLKTILDSFEHTLKNKQKILTFHKLGSCYHMIDNYKDSEYYFEKAEMLARKLADAQLLAKLTGDYGVLLKKRGLYKKALKYFQMNIKYSKKSQDLRSVAYAYNNMGNIQMNKGENQEAETNYSKALKIAVKIGDKLAQCITTGNLGIIYMKFEKYQKSLRYYRRSLELSKQIDDKIGIAINNGNMAICLKHLGRFKEAIKCIQTRIEINRQLGDRSGTAFAYGNLGNVEVDLGKYEKAIHSYQQMLKIAEDIGYKIGITLAKANLAGVYLKQKRFVKAMQSVEAAIKLERELDLKDHLSQDLNLKAYLFYRKKQLTKASEFNKEALQLAYKVQSANLIFEAEILQSEIEFFLTDSFPKRKKIISKIATKIDKCTSDFRRAVLFTKLGTFYQKLGDKKLSQENRKKAVEIYEKLYKKNSNYDILVKIKDIKKAIEEV